MSPRRGPVFLERKTYRLRRLTDAARLLPIFGALLWAVPLLWRSDADARVSTSEAMLYIFGIWFVLVLAISLLSRRLRDLAHLDPDEENR